MVLCAMNCLRSGERDIIHMLCAFISDNLLIFLISIIKRALLTLASTGACVIEAWFPSAPVLYVTLFA